jgi:membrane-associated protein
MNSLIDFILHIDKHLEEIVLQYQSWTYGILFLIVFAETGLIVTPFLPGDSLLFAAGTLAGPAFGLLNPIVLIGLLFIAAFIGDQTNYFVGNYFGPKVFDMNIRFLKKKYLMQTHEFYEKHGGKTVIIARFMPIIRTFAPFVAGVGSMTYKKFITFSILGNLLWINLFVWLGFLFGSLEFVQKNFPLFTLGIIGISVMPMVIGIIRAKLGK